MRNIHIFTVKSVLTLITVTFILTTCGGGGDRDEETQQIYDQIAALKALSSTTPKILSKKDQIKTVRLRAEHGGDSKEDGSKSFLDTFKTLYKLDAPRDNFEGIRHGLHTVSGVEREHIYLRQKKDDIPIFGAEIAIHFHDNEIVGINGNYVKDGKVFASSTPAVTAEASLKAMADALKAADGDDDYSMTIVGAPSLISHIRCSSPIVMANGLSSWTLTKTSFAR